MIGCLERSKKAVPIVLDDVTSDVKKALRRFGVALVIGNAPKERVRGIALWVDSQQRLRSRGGPIQMIRRIGKVLSESFPIENLASRLRGSPSDLKPDRVRLPHQAASLTVRAVCDDTGSILPGRKPIKKLHLPLRALQWPQRDGLWSDDWHEWLSGQSRNAVLDSKADWDGFAIAGEMQVKGRTRAER